MPVLTVIAGPNGSGKSTLTKTLDFEGRENLLDPDLIARRMNAADPGSVSVAAAREILRRINRYLETRVSFAIETTLASRRTLNVLREAKARGFSVELVYVCLDSSEQSIRRVQERVSQGGHDVPDSDIQRRYARSLANAPEAIRIADRTIVYDNTKNAHYKMLEAQYGGVTWNATKEPEWVAALRHALHS